MTDSLRATYIPGGSSDAEFYILSQRAQNETPAIGCLIEMEEVFADALDARILAPGIRASGRGVKAKLINRLAPVRAEIPRARTRGRQVLIVTGLGLPILRTLGQVPGWRSRFDTVVAYVMDAFGPVRSDIASVLSQIDHLFIPMSGNLDMYHAIDGVSATMIPYACNVARFGPGTPDKFIDVIGYGRQRADHSRIIQQTFNAPTHPRMYYHTNYMTGMRIADHAAQRALFWKILKRSNITLAYDTLSANTRGFTFSLVAQRWFEGLTAGCVIVGNRPTCPEADRLLDWEDATIEMPAPVNEVVPFLEDLLTAPDRIDCIARRNRQQAMLRHDWRHRLADMLNVMGMDPPDRLSASLEDLATLAGQV